MLLLLLIRWFCNSLTNAHTSKNLKTGSAASILNEQTPCGRVCKYFVDHLVGSGWGGGGGPRRPGVIHIRHNPVYASPLAHSLVLDTVCRSAKFFLCLSGAGQIPGLAFGSVLWVDRGLPVCGAANPGIFHQPFSLSHLFTQINYML